MEPGSNEISMILCSGHTVVDHADGGLVDSQVNDVDEFGGKPLTQPAAARVAFSPTSTAPWHNPAHPLDVNNDRVIAPLDVLLVINYLNRHGSTAIPPGSPPPNGYFINTSGDQSVTPIDALLVINCLNRPDCPKFLDAFTVATVDGHRLMVQERLPSGRLGEPAPYTIQGVSWSPASRGTVGPEFDQQGMRHEFVQWVETDAALIADMNANTVKTYLDFGVGDTEQEDWKFVLDELHARGLKAIVSLSPARPFTEQITRVVDTYKNHPAILMWMIGNEWNLNLVYGAYSSVTEAAKAIEEAAQLVKQLDPHHPVASSWGEPNYPSFATTKEIIANHCPSVEVWSFNVFRGQTFGNLFDQWQEITALTGPKPMLVGEFGLDAYDSVLGQEDQIAQRDQLYFQWQHIRNNLSAEDAARVCLGGTVFAFNDEWWKDRAGSPWEHDLGGWPSGNSPDGYASEEWWGLVDIDRNPRLAYTLMQEYFGGGTPEPPEF
jgi:hypothetical protein